MPMQENPGLNEKAEMFAKPFRGSGSAMLTPPTAFPFHMESGLDETAFIGGEPKLVDVPLSEDTGYKTRKPGRKEGRTGAGQWIQDSLLIWM